MTAMMHSHAYVSGRHTHVSDTAAQCRGRNGYCGNWKSLATGRRKGHCHRTAGSTRADDVTSCWRRRKTAALSLADDNNNVVPRQQCAVLSRARPWNSRRRTPFVPRPRWQRAHLRSRGPGGEIEWNGRAIHVTTFSVRLASPAGGATAATTNDVRSSRSHHFGAGQWKIRAVELGHDTNILVFVRPVRTFDGRRRHIRIFTRAAGHNVMHILWPRDAVIAMSLKL